MPETYQEEVERWRRETLPAPFDIDAYISEAMPEPFDVDSYIKQAVSPSESDVIESFAELNRWLGERTPEPIQRASEVLGNTWVWAVRMLPGNENLKDWKDLTEAEKLWASTQAMAMVGAVTAAVGAGISGITAIRNWAKFKHGVKLIEKESKAITDRAAEALRLKGLKLGVKAELRPRTLEEIRKGYVGPWRAEEAITEKIRLPGGGPAFPQLLKQLKQKFANVKVISKTEFHPSLENTIYQQLDAISPPGVTAQAIQEQAARTANNLVRGLPTEFSPELAYRIIDRAPLMVPAAIAQLQKLATKNLPYLARFLDDTGIDRVSRNRVLNIIRTTGGSIEPDQVRQIANDFLTSEAAKKEHFGFGEQTAMVDKQLSLSGQIQEAIDRWRAVGAPKAEVADEALVLASTEAQTKIGELYKKKILAPRRFQSLLKLLTEKDKVSELSESEAGIFIKSIEYIRDLKHVRRALHPEATDLIPMDFFEKKKREAGFKMMAIPAWRVFEWIGAKEQVYDPVEEAVVNWMIEERDKFARYNEMRKEVGKGVDVSRRIWDYLNGTPLAGVKWKGAVLPLGAVRPKEVTLVGKELAVAVELRAILDDLADRMKLPLDKRKENYIIHIFEALTSRELAKKYPLSDEVMNALDFGVPKKIFARTLLERLGRKEGLKKDVWASMRAVTAIDLRKIHLEPAYESVRPFIKFYPKTARKYIEDWLNIAVLKHHSKIDERINADIKWLDDFLIKVSKGKASLGSNPSKTLAYAYTRLGYGGAMTFNIAIAGKNLTQQFLIIPMLNNPVNYAKAWSFRFSERGRMLLKESQVLKARFPMEMFDPKDVQGWMSKGMAPYRAADWLNVSQAFLSGYMDALEQKMSYNEAIKYADRIAKISQYSYRPMDMPEFMWKGGAPGRMAGMLQTWPINYWTNYMPELGYRLLTGKDTEGNPVSKKQRAGLLTYIAITSAFIYAMYKHAKVDFRKIFGPGVIPTYFSPPVTLSMNIGKRVLGLATGDYRMVRDADRGIARSIPIFIPTGLQSKKIHGAYKKLAEGLERDSYGRVRRIVSKEEAIKSVFTYPAEQTEFYRVQNKVWDLSLQIDESRKKLLNATLTYKQKEKIFKKLRKLSIEITPYKRDLTKLTQGLPAEETNQLFIDQMKWLTLGR